MAYLPQTRQGNRGQIVGVQPTTPPSDPIPVEVTSGKTLKSIPINATVLGDNIIVPAVLGMRIKVYAVTLIVNAAVTVTWKSGANAKTGPMPFAAQGQGYALSVNPPEFLNSHSTNTGEALILNLSGAVAVAGSVDYWDSDAT